MARQWILTGQKGFETSLEFQENVKVPSADELRPDQVLVELRAASLNYRELILADPSAKFGPIQAPLVPGCDGAGVVLAVGSSVGEFRPGDKVVTYCAGKVAKERGDGAHCMLSDAPSMLGSGTDGTLRTHGVFLDTDLVHAPKSLDWVVAASIPVTWTTAWNVLFGVRGKEAGPGTWVLVQGTAGTSIAILQLAIAAGATVVATTSTEEKGARLRALGALHTVNYRTNPDGWGTEARALTPNGRGFDIIADIGGNETLNQSLAAVRVDEIVSLVGGVGDESAGPVPLAAVFLHNCFVRGPLASPRGMFRDLVRYIDEKNLKPVVDDVVFELAEAKDAYRRLHEKKHFSKVVIRIDHQKA